MKIKEKIICRGSGKIFIQYEAVPDFKESKLFMSDSDSEGNSIPSDLYDYENIDADGAMQVVAVIPNIPLTQHLSFEEILPSGESAGKPVVKTVGFDRAKWSSRLNYRLNSRVANEIRNFDESKRDEQIFIEFDELIPFSDHNIVRLTLYAPESSDNISIECYTPKRQWSSREVIWMGEQRLPSKGKADVPIKEVRCSISLPKGADYFVFEVTDREHPELDSFGVLEPKMISDMERSWNLAHHWPVTGEDYGKWFEKKRAKRYELAQQKSIRFSSSPKFSIIVPLYKTPLRFFEEMADSVIAQSYSDWELVLVNASPEDEGLASAIQAYASRDKRIRVLTIPENLGISGNTQVGIAHATGDFVCFFDHDDTLEPDILFEYASVIEKDPDTGLIYCDEDKLLPNGNYGAPYFKPSFSIDLLRNYNYICHMLCIRKSLLDELEPSPSDVDGAQDFDLTLKAVERTDHVHHVKKVLYHWRIHEGSTAAGSGAKPEALKAGQTAIQRHLDRLGIKGEVISNDHIELSYTVRYEVIGEPKVSIIIPNKDLSGMLRRCIDSIIEKTTYRNYEIVIVENNSTEDETFAYYDEITARDGRVKVVTWKGRGFNFSKLVNYGARASEGDYYLLLNNDTEVITPDWLELMVGFCQRDDVGVVGVRLWYPDDTVQHGGVALLNETPAHLYHGHPKGDVGYFGLLALPQNLSAVTGACMMTPKETFDSVGGFDEEFAVAFNDIDYCLKVIDAGQLVVYLPLVDLYHHESVSRGYEYSTRKKIRFMEEVSLLRMNWASYFVNGDRYFNRNLYEKID